MQEEKASYDKPDIFCPCNIPRTDYIIDITTNNEVNMKMTHILCIPFAIAFILHSVLTAEATELPPCSVEVVDSEIEILDATTVLE